MFKLLDSAWITVIGASGNRSLKAQLKQADAWDIAQAVIIGEEEMKKGTGVVRDTARGEQREIFIEELSSLLQK